MPSICIPTAASFRKHHTKLSFEVQRVGQHTYHVRVARSLMGMLGHDHLDGINDRGYLGATNHWAVHSNYRAYHT